MIAHGHGDDTFAQYSNEFCHNDPNFLTSFVYIRKLVNLQVLNWRTLLEQSLCLKISLFKWTTMLK
jgi:hypothetical protein